MRHHERHTLEAQPFSREESRGCGEREYTSFDARGVAHRLRSISDPRDVFAVSGAGEHHVLQRRVHRVVLRDDGSALRQLFEECAVEP